jgi:RNase H-like domain found in reverse transcriptase
MSILLNMWDTSSLPLVFLWTLLKFKPLKIGQFLKPLKKSNPSWASLTSTVASISKPLMTLTKKTVDFAWSSACQSVFEFLKTQFNSSTILAHFHPDCATVVETDASNYAIAAVLSQIDPVDNLLHLIAFYSQSMC